LKNGHCRKSNSAWNKARQRLPFKKFEAFVDAICSHLSEQSEPVWRGRRRMILDGTIITRPPGSVLKTAFPSATNQHGESVWPLAILMVASEPATGCVLTPEIGAMYGPDNTSEANAGHWANWICDDRTWRLIAVI
jgi:hypothetical protein